MGDVAYRRRRASPALAIISLLAAVSARGASHTEALLLTCMDYRLTDDVVRYMEERGLHDAYDHVILAGAALGAQTHQHRAWGRTFWEHLDVALALHHIQRVVLLDHRDCGAYKVFLGKDLASDRDRETEVHARYLRELKKRILAKHPALQVDMGIMDLDGSVEVVN